MTSSGDPPVYDYLVIGSGFGGSVSAMRLAEKGYRVVVLERGRRFRDEDFARTNWDVSNYLWLPALRCYGIQSMTLLRDVLVLGGSGVGGGSLVYANVLMEPDPRLFDAPAWRHLTDWQQELAPHYAAARRMLGVTQNPCLWPADHILERVSAQMGRDHTFNPTQVGVFFGEPGREGETVPDPYFGGEGPPRAGCTECGGCMVGCRYNAKNTLVKNYLYFAEALGAQVEAETTATAIRPQPPDQPDGARYEVAARPSTTWLGGRKRHFRARNVIVAAGVLGTLSLLYDCRDRLGTLPALSARLGERVRTNSEALLGVTARDDAADYSRGVAITSVFHADEATAIEPVRYPPGSSFMRLLAAPLVTAGGRGVVWRWLRVGAEALRRPLDLLRAKLFPRWAERTTILLVMQTEDTLMRLSYGRGLLRPFRPGLRSEPDPEHRIQAEIPAGHAVTRAFAGQMNGIPQGAVNESLLGIPTTAHILGGIPFGRDASEGVIDLDCQVHGYPGLYVVDGSIVPANPGINPSLTIAALAEYAMSLVPPAGSRRPGASHPHD